MAIPFSEAQQPDPSALIELFELQLVAAIHGADTVYRFHAGINAKQTGDVIWAGNSYMAFPIEADGFAWNGNGQLPRPSLKASNVMGSITALLLSLPSGLEGARVTRIRTHARFLDAVNFPGNVNPWGASDPTSEYAREIYYVDRKKGESQEVVEFELASPFDLANVRVPKRQVLSSICLWTPLECVYASTCGKKLSDCKANYGADNQLPFGSFPAAGTFQ